MSNGTPASGGLTPKFFVKNGADAQACARPSNVKTRGLLAESTRLGALSENFVQITSSRADEVSFDEPRKGGIATQSVRDCLLGAAVDRDASGAVSVREVEQCAQAIVERKLKPYADLTPQHVSVTGNRNIVPVPAPVASSAPAAVPVSAPPAPVAPPAVEPAVASLATLRDIDAQRNPRRHVDVELSRNPLRIGKDALELAVRSNHDGYLYLVLLGSDRKSFYLLFPNSLDRDNTISADTRLTLPRPGWSLAARGPAGTDHLLALVSDTPRDLGALTPAPPQSAMPFTFALNDLPGRGALIDFFTGRGVTGTSESFGARLLSIQEVETGAAARMLVTAREAAASRAAPRPPPTKTVPVPGAPRIDLLAPDLSGPVPSPTRILVKFEPTPPAAIRPESFRVRYGALRLDITGRITAVSRVVADGIDVAEAALPKGSHRLQLEIQDSVGRKGERTLEFVVD
jgi:hypothetical protein